MCKGTVIPLSSPLRYGFALYFVLLCDTDEAGVHAGAQLRYIVGVPRSSQLPVCSQEEPYCFVADDQIGAQQNFFFSLKVAHLHPSVFESRVRYHDSFFNAVSQLFHVLLDGGG